MKKFNFKILIIIILFLLFLFLIKEIYTLGIIPLYIVIFLTLILALINIGISFLLFRNQKPLKILGVILCLIIMLFNIFGIYYLNVTNNFLSNSFSGKVIESTTYYIISKEENKRDAKEIDDFVYYYENLINKKLLLDKIKDNYNFSIKEYGDINKMVEDLINDKIKYIILEKTSFNIFKQFNKEFNEKCCVLSTINVKEEQKSEYNSKNYFNILVVGSDFAGLNDFNMLISVNVDKKRAILTSIPRDYHIEVAGMNGVKDNITYMSALGIDTSVRSLEKFFDINIDYYVKINTSSLVRLVDEIGGITYCSDYEYETSHALVLDTYNDAGKKKLYVKKGCQHLNGIETLTVARERKKFPGSDGARQENCRRIVLSIFDKMKSVDSVINYSSLLESLGDLYETTLPRSVIENIGKDVLKSNSKWQISEQLVNGTDVIGYVHLNSVRDYTMEPDMNTVNSAIKNIKSLGD